MSTSDCVIVLTTVAADADLTTFVRTLVAERLAACVNILPEMQSIYRWEGAIEEAAERQVIVKTRTSCVDRLKRRIGELHTYDVPEILVVPIADGGEAYLNWIRESTSA